MEEVYDVEGKLLSDDKIDIAVFNETVHDQRLEYQVLKKDETLLLVNQNHPFAKKGKAISGCRHPWIDLKLFKNDNFILLNSNLHTGKVSAELLMKQG